MGISQLFDKTDINSLEKIGNYKLDPKKLLRLDYFCQYASKNNVRVKFVLLPMHLRSLISLKLKDKIDHLFEWKRQLVALSSCSDFNFYDFAMLNPFVMEKIAGQNLSNTRWYWETSHFKHELGKLIISEIFIEDEIKKTIWGKSLKKHKLRDQAKVMLSELNEIIRSQHPDSLRVIELHNNFQRNRTIDEK